MGIYSSNFDTKFWINRTDKEGNRKENHYDGDERENEKENGEL